MATGIEVDWILIQVNTIRKLIAVIAVGLIAAALVYVAKKQMNQPPEVRAKRAIENARSSHEEARSQPMPSAWIGELEQAESQLAQAQEAYTDENWAAAIDEAESARYRFEALLGANNSAAVGVGQFISIGGRVSVQRAGKSEWDSVATQMPVFNGDFVKSGKDGTAEIMFSDGTMYRISPNSLLEIHHKGKRFGDDSGTVTMKVGKVNVFTSGSKSTVETDTARTEITSDSQVELGVSEDRTEITAYRGSAKIRDQKGRFVQIAAREQISTSGDEGFTEKVRIPDPPAPIEPPHNRSFELAKHPVIHLTWKVRTETDRIHLQVSRSKHFLTDRIDVDEDSLRKNSARLETIAPGTYFWRVAGVSSEDIRSEWSEVRRFRIFSRDRQILMKDHTPPDLVVKQAQQLGHMFIVEGTTEVGAVVSINGERVEVRGDGHFRKAIEMRQNGRAKIVVIAVDPSGNKTERSETVNVEVY